MDIRLNGNNWVKLDRFLPLQNILYFVDKFNFVFVSFVWNVKSMLTVIIIIRTDSRDVSHRRIYRFSLLFLFFFSFFLFSSSFDSVCFVDSSLAPCLFLVDSLLIPRWFPLDFLLIFSLIYLWCVPSFSFIWIIGSITRDKNVSFRLVYREAMNSGYIAQANRQFDAPSCLFPKRSALLR